MLQESVCACVCVRGGGGGACSRACSVKSPQIGKAAPHPVSMGRGFAWAGSHSVTDPLLIGYDDENFGAP